MYTQGPPEAAFDDSGDRVYYDTTSFRVSDLRLMSMPNGSAINRLAKGQKFRAWAENFSDQASRTRVGIVDLTTGISKLVGNVKVESSLADLAPTRDGKRLAVASSSSSGRIDVYNTDNGSLVRTYSFAGKWIRDIDYSPDDSRIAIVTGNAELMIIRTADGVVEKALEWSGNGVRKVAFSPDWNFVAIAGSTVTRVWNLAQSHVVNDLPGSSDSLAVSNDGNRVVLANPTRVYDVPSNSLVAMQGRKDSLSVGISGDGKTIALFNSGTFDTVLNGSDATVRSVAQPWTQKTAQPKISHDGRNVFVTCITTVYKLDSQLGTEIGHTVPVGAANRLSKAGDFMTCWSPTLSYLRMFVVDGATLKTTSFIDQNLARCLDSDVSSDGTVAVTSHTSDGGTVIAFDTATQKRLWTLTGIGKEPSVSISPDSKDILVRSSSGCRKYDLKTGMFLRAYFLPSSGPGWVDYSPSGNLMVLVFGSSRRRVLVFDEGTGVAWGQYSNQHVLLRNRSDVFVDERTDRIYIGSGGGVQAFNRGSSELFGQVGVFNSEVDMRPDLGLFAFSLTSEPTGDQVGDWTCLSTLGP